VILVSPFLQATKTLRESRGIALLCFYTSAVEGGEGSRSRPGRWEEQNVTITFVVLLIFLYILCISLLF
jgi:hypothetical protein